MYKIEYNESYKSLRWVGYIDLLGTQKLINDNKAKEIFAVYKIAIEEFKDQSGKMEEILYKMMNCQEDRYKRKYQNTIDFLNNNKRCVHL